MPSNPESRSNEPSKAPAVKGSRSAGPGGPARGNSARQSQAAPKSIRAGEGAEGSDEPLCRVPENCPWPIILGLDPGTKIMGYGAILDAQGDHRLLAAGTIRPIGDEAPARLADIQRQVGELFERLRPTVIVVETAFSTQNIQSALRLGEARGVLLACAARWGSQIVQYAPAVPRKTLLGNGNAKKDQVAAMVANLLSLAEPPKPLDVTDALSLALAFLHRGKTLDRLTRGSSKSRLQP